MDKKSYQQKTVIPLIKGSLRIKKLRDVQQEREGTSLNYFKVFLAAMSSSRSDDVTKSVREGFKN